MEAMSYFGSSVVITYAQFSEGPQILRFLNMVRTYCQKNSYKSHRNYVQKFVSETLKY